MISYVLTVKRAFAMLQSYDVSLIEAVAGVSVGRLLRSAPERDCPACPAKRPADSSEVSRDAMRLATNHRHKSCRGNSIHRHLRMALHRRTGGKRSQDRDDNARAAQRRDGLRHDGTARSKHTGALHQDSAQTVEDLGTQLPLQHGVRARL